MRTNPVRVSLAAMLAAAPLSIAPPPAQCAQELTPAELGSIKGSGLCDCGKEGLCIEHACTFLGTACYSVSPVRFVGTTTHDTMSPQPNDCGALYKWFLTCWVWIGGCGGKYPDFDPSCI